MRDNRIGDAVELRANDGDLAGQCQASRNWRIAVSAIAIHQHDQWVQYRPPLCTVDMAVFAKMWVEDQWTRGGIYQMSTASKDTMLIQ